MDEPTGKTRKTAAAPTPAHPDAGDGTTDSAPRAAEPARPSAPVRTVPLDRVDDASDDSFPASDPPAFTKMRVGSPKSGG